MTKALGREATFTVNSSAVAGVRTKNLTLNKEPVNVTDDDSSGVQELLAEPGEKSIEFSVDGIIDDRVLREAWFGTEQLDTIAVTWPNGDTLSGSFKMTAYSEGKPYNEAITFEATFQSAGTWTYTAASP